MDVDENHSEADQRPHHPLKSAQSPQPSALKTHLTNGNVVDGMEAEDSDPANNEIAVPKSPSERPEAPLLRVHEPPPALDCSSADLNGNGDLEAPPSLGASELSPTLRRSTRAACLKAQEKLKLKDGMVDSHAVENGPTTTVTSTLPEMSVQTTAANAEIMETPQKKKRKLSTGAELDQDDCKFGIRLDDDGDVVLMTDESDISSLNDEEAAVIRQKFEETKNKLNELTPETQREREFQVRELEAAVRLEEAKLAMLKKTRSNQQLTARNAAQEATRRLAAGNQNSTGTAYKPAVAQQTNARVNGTSNAAVLAAAAKTNHRGRGAKTNTSPANPLLQMTPHQQQVLKQLVDSGSLRPEQILALIQAMNPGALAGLNPNAARQQAQQREQQQQREAQERERRQQAEREAAARKAAEAQAAAERLARENAQNAQQKIAAARVQFRRIAEQRMLAALPPPKAPAPDLSFVPNAAQPDFLYLLGLDLVVQRNLKDKNVFKKVEFEPYVCEECGTDFTPNWKAIAGEKGDLHLYCEQCLRQAQKRRVRHDRNTLLKKLFTKINDEEKEFERQIQNGKLAESLGAVSSSNSSKVDTKAESKVESTPPTSKPPGLPTNFNAAALSNLMNNMKGLPHSASSLLNSAASSSNNSSANRNAAAATSLAAASRSTPKQEAKKPAPSTPSRGAKRGHSSSSTSNSNAFNSQLAALASNPQAMTQFVGQLQTLQALRNMNPAVLGNVNSQAILQLYQQRMNASSANAGNNVNVMSQLMNQLSTLAQNQNHNTSTTTSATSNHQQSSHHSGSGSSNSAANLLQQMNQMGVNSALFRQLANARNGSDNAAAQNLFQQMAAAAARKK